MAGAAVSRSAFLSAVLFFAVISRRISAHAPTRFLQPSEEEPTLGMPNSLGDQVLVAAGEQVRYTLHVFDLAFYLANTSSLWGTNISAEQLIKAAPGEATLRYDIVSPLVTKERIGQAVEEKVKKQVDEDEWKTIDGVFVERLRQGPFKGVGSIIEMKLQKDGVRIKMDGKDMGFVASSALPRALLSIYFDQDASNQAFIGTTLDRIAAGIPQADTSVNVVVDSSGRFLRIGIFVGLCIFVCVCILAFVSYLFCGRRTETCPTEK